MPVKSNQSAARVLAVLEAIARHQPVGVSAVARHLKEDKSAVQRALLTLAQSGWIGVVPGSAAQWELTAHIFSIAHMSYSRSEWRHRARMALEALREESGESAILVIPDARHFVVVDVVESRQTLRTTTTIGTIVPVRESASGRAMLAFMSKERQIDMLGTAPPRVLVEQLRAVRKCGYAVSIGVVFAGAANIAAPIFEANGSPVGAVAITGPAGRLSEKQCAKIGKLLVKSALALSRGRPSDPMVR
jgi:DNA-binding IclR family transcriptional regulator